MSIFQDFSGLNSYDRGVLFGIAQAMNAMGVFELRITERDQENIIGKRQTYDYDQLTGDKVYLLRVDVEVEGQVLAPMDRRLDGPDVIEGEIV